VVMVVIFFFYLYCGMEDVVFVLCDMFDLYFGRFRVV
jgi:hypothetical protein